MSERFVVEAGRKVVGVAVRCAGGYRFYASEDGFFPLENRSFPSVRALTSAAGSLARARGNSPESLRTPGLTAN